MLLDAFRDRGWATSGPRPTDMELQHLQLPASHEWTWFVEELEQAEPTSQLNWRLNGLKCMFDAWKSGGCLMPMCETCGAQCQDSQSECLRCHCHLCSNCKGGMAKNYDDGNCLQCQ